MRHRTYLVSSGPNPPNEEAAVAYGRIQFRMDGAVHSLINPYVKLKLICIMSIVNHLRRRKSISTQGKTITGTIALAAAVISAHIAVGAICVLCAVAARVRTGGAVHAHALLGGLK